LYERLGVDPAASQAEIRAAYRRLARRVHPDRGGSGSEAAMAAVNEAWRVLGDPARRANYDASLRPQAIVIGGASTTTVQPPVRAEDEEEGRSFLAVALPWIVVLAVLGGIFLFTAYARGGPGGGAGTTVSGESVDGVVGIGSCIVLDSRARAVEKSCGGPHLGVTKAIVAAQAPCPLGTEGFYSLDAVRLICISRD
jgi:DnaJ-like protein